jgi:hydroxymethylbilane synthase
VRAVRIGTRGSPLALWQARAVAALIEGAACRVELVTIKTSGDRMQQAPLARAGGKGLFVKEIEEALLAGEIDLAVHSAKDMSVALPEGLTVGAVLPREDSRDALVLPGDAGHLDLDEAMARLGDAPSIGTDSVRRVAQLSGRWPRARFVSIRGNVDTRLRKLDAANPREYDAIVLAVAGLKRLGHASRVSVALQQEVCVPAPGQGIVAVETRAGDEGLAALLMRVNDSSAAICFEAERAVVAALGGGCHLPLGAVAVQTRHTLDMQAIVASPDGRRIVTRRGRGEASQPAALGRRLADELAAGGAHAILDEVR